MPMVDRETWFEARLLMKATRRYGLEATTEMITALWGGGDQSRS